MLHKRPDPTNAMIGGDSSQTRAPWRVQVKGLTKICLCLIGPPPSTPDFLGKVGLNLALGLIPSCCCRQTACWRPACCWLVWGSMSIGDPSKSHKGGSRFFIKELNTNYFISFSSLIYLIYLFNNSRLQVLLSINDRYLRLWNHTD